MRDPSVRSENCQKVARREIPSDPHFKNLSLARFMEHQLGEARVQVGKQEGTTEILVRVDGSSDKAKGSDYGETGLGKELPGFGNCMW